MAAPTALLRLTEDGATMLRAEAGAGGLTNVQVARDGTRCLTSEGAPTRAVSSVAAKLMRELDITSAMLVLPPHVATLARAVTDVPAPGTVTGQTIEAAVAQAREAVARPGQAVLSCRPYAYAADGEAGAEAPLRARPRSLSVHTASLSASVPLLSAFDAALRPLALSGVVTAAEAVGAALLPDGEGAAILVGRHGTLAVALTAGVVTAQAHVPVGRRHLEGDLGQARALEPPEAARRTDAVLSGTSSDDIAIEAVTARLEELSRLLAVATERAGLDLTDAVLSGLPPRAAPRVAGAAPASPSLPPALSDEPELAGAALLTLGLRGSLDRAELALPPKRSALGWLLRRF